MDDPEPTSLFLITFLQIPSEFYITLGILILLLILISITSGSEVAFLSLTQKDLDKNRGKFPSQIDAISKIKRNSRQFISTVLVFSNLVNIGIILLSANISEALVTNFHYSELVRIISDLVVITLIILIIGEIIPKIYARKNAFTYSCKTIGFVNLITRLCYPVTRLMLLLSNKIDKYFKKDTHIGVDNLTQALEIASEDESTSDAEQKILEGIVNFGTIETRQVMTPRVDVFSLQKDLSFKTVIDLVSQNGYSRIPVYNKDIDDIIGVLYSKDLIQYLNLDDFDWNTLLRKPYFIPENKKIDDLLSDFKNRKMHLAIVVDEYGGTSGIVSMEDVIEEIVGEINDEFDENEISYSKIDDNIYVFEGKTSIIDFCRVMDIDEKEFEYVKGDADTLAGLVLELAEEFPKRLQKIQYKNFLFQIESLDRKRLKQIKITQKIQDEKNDDKK